jgi:molybdate transport system substrate-binding protein
MKVAAFVRRIAGGLLVASLLGVPPAVDAQGGAPASSLRGEIVVSAAASLTDAFAELGDRFRTVHPQVRVRFNFGSSTALVAQIQSGAPATVFASADRLSQERLLRSGNLVSVPRALARNTLQIAVKPGNPMRIGSLADLVGAGTVALCAKTVPCGVYAASVLTRSGVTLAESSITRGVDAKATLASAAFGDAVAAIVYATDVRAAGGSVRAVEIPSRYNVRALYGISLVRDGPNRAVGQGFVNFVLSAEGRSVLRKYGFVAP